MCDNPHCGQLRLFIEMAPRNEIVSASLLQRVSPLYSTFQPYICSTTWARYGAYLEQLRGPEYREQVFAYIEQEDTPRSVLYQVDLLREVGFREVEILHKNGCFAAFGAVKGKRMGRNGTDPE
jgi:hypothetical protein